jgi:spermidine synthase/tetratricopeptide (TPR) repeat protein
LPVHMITGLFARGVAAGSIVLFWTLLLRLLLPNAWYGSYPLALAVLPFLAGLAIRRPLLPAMKRPATGPGSRLRGKAAILLLALATPLLFWLLYVTTNGLPFLDGSSSPLQFLWLLLICLLFAGLPLDAVTASMTPREEEHNISITESGWILLGMGSGAAVLSLPATLPLPWLFLLLCIMLSGILLPLRETPPETTTPQKGGKRMTRLPSPAVPLRYGLPALLAFALTVLLHLIAETPVAVDGSGMLLLAATVAGAGAGLLLAHRLRMHWPRKTSLPDLSVIAALLAVLLVALSLLDFWSDRFPLFYRMWYEGETAGLPLSGLLPGFVLGVLALAIASVTRDGKQPRMDMRLPLILSAGIGLLLAFFLRTIADIQHVAMALIAVGMLLAVYEFIRDFRKTPGHAITLAAIILIGYLAIPSAQPSFRNYFDPVNFQITGEVRAPAGRLTQLGARNDDDRFLTLFWQQSRALMQSSRAVKNDLYRMGHLPMLTQPRGARVLLLGLGSGLPLGAVSMHDPSRIVCVEPMAGTPRLALERSRYGHPLRRLDEVRLRNERIPAFLDRGSERFDVIIGAEPFAVPQPDLFLLTERYFRSVARRLDDNGVFMQWLPVARVDAASVRRVISGMLSVFPSAELWLSSADPESAMIGILAGKSEHGTPRPTQQRFAELKEEPAQVFHLQQIQFDRFAAALACFGMDNEALRRLAADAAPFTCFDPVDRLSDRPLQDLAADVEYILSRRSAPAGLLDGVPDSVGALAQGIRAERPTILRAQTAVLMGNDTNAVRLLGDALARTPENAEVRRVMGDLMLRQAAGYVGAGEYPTAVALLNNALQLLPINTYMLRLFMIASFHTGDREASGLAIDGIKRLDPGHAAFRDNQATIRAQQGATDAALLLYENAISLDPSNEEYYCNMASFHYSQGRAWEAIRTLDQATLRSYYPAKPWYLKGLFYAEQGRIRFAREAYLNYLDVSTPLDPHREEVHGRLIRLREFEDNPQRGIQ